MQDNGIKQEDFLMLSGIQHFAFCPRQWALIHVEGQWSENLRTVEGNILHERCHDKDFRERRGDVLTLRDLRIHSNQLGFSGACDVVEFHFDKDGISLTGEDGLWLPYPVEYKRGKPKEHMADELQLCAQAICLEEMLCCNIPEGALFYGENRRRTRVEFTDSLREKVVYFANEMHRYASQGYTPKVKPRKGCRFCSLNDTCIPKLITKKSAKKWITSRITEEEAE